MTYLSLLLGAMELIKLFVRAGERSKAISEGETREISRQLNAFKVSVQKARRARNLIRASDRGIDDTSGLSDDGYRRD